MVKKYEKSAEEILKEESGEYREFRPFERYLTNFVALAWTIFQMLLPSVILLNSNFVRSIHLAFALALGYLTLPAFKRPKTKFGKAISPMNKIAIHDYLFAIAGVVCATYIIWDWEGLSARAGLPTIRDISIGLLIVILTLEATRRSIGTPLAIIATLFSLYGFFAESMPALLAFKNVTLNKYVSQIALSTEGIFGIPIGVSANIVFLFVLMGSMLDKAGAGKYFIDLAISLLGSFRGGPAKAAVIASGLSGMVSGSSIANVVTTGTFTIPLMKSVGYPPQKAAAIEVAASTNGQLMPPIMGAAAFIIAEYVNVPYIDVVKAAIIPAFTSYIALLYITHLEACKLGIKGIPKSELPSFIKTLFSGLHYLIPIFWLLIELIVLRHSPQLAAYRTVLLLILVIFYQEIRNSLKKENDILKGIKNAISLTLTGFITGAKSMVGVALATAAAGIVVGMVSLGIGGMVNEIVDSIANGNIYILLFVTAIASLILGMGLPTTANYIVMASLTAPLIVKIGTAYGFIVPLMAAHMFVFFFGILADDTPPVGLAAYAAAAIADSPPIKTGVQGFMYDIRTAIIPFMFIFNHDLILDGVTSWTFGIFIFIVATFGAMMFASAMQGWFVTKNSIIETVMLLAASLLFYRPAILSNRFGLEEDLKYYFYVVPVILVAVTYLLQRQRVKKTQRIQ
jgi:TRAP transporter 4TM/12TM fusion protein